MYEIKFGKSRQLKKKKEKEKLQQKRRQQQKILIEYSCQIVCVKSDPKDMAAAVCFFLIIKKKYETDETIEVIFQWEIVFIGHSSLLVYDFYAN